MPPKRLRTDIKISPSEHKFLCEWEECKDVFKEMDPFIKHMEKHLTERSYQADDRDDVFLCAWRDCGTQVIGAFTDFCRHSYFHCFHVKIKNIGQILVDKTKSQGCLLDTQSRNLIPELPERLQCGWKQCDTILDNPEIFYRHVDNHSLNFPEGKKLAHGCKCDWEGCDVITKDRYKMREHLRSHTQERIVGCPTCGGLFSSRSKFFDHLHRQEEHSLLCYQCSHCNKKFSTERLLRDHVRHHVNQYKCPFCEMTCPTPSSLKSHIRYRHTSEKPFKCDLCQHSTKTMADLRKHLESHNQEMPFKCHMPGCNYSARSYSSLANHFKKNHQNIQTQKYACHVCKSVFTRGGKLTKHLKKNHNFKWPSGHSRFRYKLHEDGFLRLQTVRYESIGLTQQLNSEDSNDSSTKDDGQDSNDPTRTVSETVTMETENITNVTIDSVDALGQVYDRGNVCDTDYNIFNVNSDSSVQPQMGVLTIDEGGPSSNAECLQNMGITVLEQGETILQREEFQTEGNADQQTDFVTMQNMSVVANVTNETGGPSSLEENRSPPRKRFKISGKKDKGVTDVVIPSEGTIPVRMESDLKVLSLTYKGSEGDKPSFSVKCNGTEENLSYNLEMLGDVALLVPEENTSPYLRLPCKTVTIPTTSSS